MNPTRYQGENLPNRPRIAVVSNDAIGNFVVATPLMQMLRSRWDPTCLDHFAGHRAMELMSASPLIDEAIPLLGTPVSASIPALIAREPYDLVFNMEFGPTAMMATALLGREGYVAGPCLQESGRGALPFQADERGDLWRDQEWASPNLSKRYPFLNSGFIAELFCRLAYLDGSVPPYALPSATPPIPIPDVLIATAASLSDKLWTPEKWLSALEFIGAQGLQVGLLGAPPKQQQEHWKGADWEEILIENGLVQDLRGKLSLPEVVGAVHSAKLVLTLDNGIMHLACSGATKVVALFRPEIQHLWLPPFGNVEPVIAPLHQPVSAIGLDEVIRAIQKALR